MAGSATGIDVGSHAVKFVQLRQASGNKFKMIKAGSTRVGDQNADEDSKARAGNVSVLLRNLINKRGARASRAAAGVTGRKVIIRYAHVPPVPNWRLTQLMQYEIEEESGGDGSEKIASDYYLLDLPNKASEFTVMVGLAKTEPVQFQMDVLEGAGVRVEEMNLTPLAVFNAFIHAMSNRSEDTHETCAIVNIGARNMDMAIERDGHLYFARNLTPGGRSFTEALQQELRVPFENAERLKVQRGRIPIAGTQPEAQPPRKADDDDTSIGLLDDARDIPMLVLEGNPDDEDTALGYDDDVKKIQEQAKPDDENRDPVAVALEAAAHSILVALQSSLMYCKAQTRIANLKVDRLYITGGAAALPGLAEYLASRLKMPVEVFDPLAGIDLSPLDQQTRAEVERDRGCYTVAIGLAMQQLNDSCVSMSLLPPPVKKKRHFMEHGFYGYAASISFVVAVGLIAGSSFLFTGRLVDWVGGLKNKERIAKNENTTKTRLETENMVIAAEVALAKRALQRGRQYNSMLTAIKKTIPDHIRVTSMQTFSASNPSYKTISREKGKYGARNRSPEPPPEHVLKLTGLVVDPPDAEETLSPEEQRKKVMAWADTFEKQTGLRGEAIFGAAKIIRHVAEGGKPGFELEIPLVQRELGKTSAVAKKKPATAPKTKTGDVAKNKTK